jgi:hypothetical protein
MGLVLSHRRLTAHDARHAAEISREGVTRILGFDTGFDELPGLTRIGA